MGSLFMALLPLLLFLLSVGPSCTEAWGMEGHFMICKIAEGYLLNTTEKAVQDLLQPWTGEAGLAEVCSWADGKEAKRLYPSSPPLHFANTPGVCNFSYCRDCHDERGRLHNCVVGAINEYTRQLQNFSDSSNKCYLSECLKFLAHFVGDAHQPLHVGFADDRGGNRIEVRWFSRSQNRNLHQVWDTSIIKTALCSIYKNDSYNMIENIKKEYIKDQDVTREDPNVYASESIAQACEYAYKDENNTIINGTSKLSDQYFSSRLLIVEKRIAQAGARLAGLLNHIFRSYPINSSLQIK